MNKKIVLIVVLAVGIIGIIVGVWWVNNNNQSVLPGRESAVLPGITLPAAADEIRRESSVLSGFIFPAAADEINWKDREIYKSGLTADAQSALNELPQASIYYLSLEIGDDISGDIDGHEIVRYTNTESSSLDEIYFRLFPNFQGGILTVTNLTVDGAEPKTQLESGFTTVTILIPRVNQ